jgi:single-stranded-DNA-specific exonuclease
MYYKKWAIKPKPKSSVIEHLVEVLNIDAVLAVLLGNRNIECFDSAKSFFRPVRENLHSPFLMKDMSRAVERIEYAMRNRERIMIYGDYDVDGTTAVAIVYSFMKKIYDNIDYYIPDRYTEGYGISYNGIDAAFEDDCKLIICLDCGIKSVEKIDYASSKGIDFIICDHHYPGAELPKAFAILNPKRADCEYPYKELSGCGVGFKLLQAFAEKNNISEEEVYQYIDLVAVSIASDIVPINGENRTLTALGINKLNENPSIGLKSIIKISGLEGAQQHVDDIVFKIGPRINAAGRMNSGKHAVELLIADEERSAKFASIDIDRYNNDRKHVDSSIHTQAIRMLSSDPEQEYRKSTVLFDPSWHKGVVGIVASRMIETYHRPTVILTQSDDYATGSARSVDGCALYATIDACSELLENFGGHKYAAGLTMKLENLEKFKIKFEKIVSETITEEQLTPQIDIDIEINFDQITPKFMRILKQFRPFGPQNMTPIFLTRNVIDIGSGRIVGKSGEHLKLDLRQVNNNVIIFPAIGFQLSEYYPIIRSKEPIDICYSIEENTFRGVTNLQLRIRDIRKSAI